MVQLSCQDDYVCFHIIEASQNKSVQATKSARAVRSVSVPYTTTVPPAHLQQTKPASRFMGPGPHEVKRVGRWLLLIETGRFIPKL